MSLDAISSLWAYSLIDRHGCRNTPILIFIAGKRQAKQSAFFRVRFLSHSMPKWKKLLTTQCFAHLRQICVTVRSSHLKPPLFSWWWLAMKQIFISQRPPFYLVFDALHLQCQPLCPQFFLILPPFNNYFWYEASFCKNTFEFLET